MYCTNVLELYNKCIVLELYNKCIVLELYNKCIVLELYNKCIILELYNKCIVLELYNKCIVIELYNTCIVPCMPTLKRLKAVGGLGLGGLPLPKNVFFRTQNGALCCILDIQSVLSNL